MTILASIFWFLKRAFWFVVDNWKIVLPAFLLYFLIIWSYNACNKPPKLNQEQIIKKQQAIAKDDRNAMLEVLAESDTAEANIDAGIQQAEQNTREAKKNYLGKSNQELADELNARANQ